MLRIIQMESVAERRWVLCGQLAGRWVRELKSLWREFARTSRTMDETDAAPDPRRVAAASGLSSIGRRKQHLIDLTDVTFIDEAGEELLRQLQEEGVDLVAGTGVDTRYLLENLRANGRRPVRRMLGRADETC